MKLREVSIMHDYKLKLPNGDFWRQKSTLLVALLVVIAIASYWYSSSRNTNTVVASNTTDVVVDITPQGFYPATISIKAGQTIEWVNEDTDPHQPATDPYPLENSLAGFRAAAPLQVGDSYSFIFANYGKYTYHDHLNPLKYTGTILVDK